MENNEIQENVAAPEQPVQPTPAPAPEQPKQEEAPKYDAKDIDENKAMGILAYIGFLCLVPIFGAPKSPFARFHANQGLVMFIGEAAIVITARILGWLSKVCLFSGLWVLSSIFSFLAVMTWLAMTFFLVISIIGIVNAAKGECKRLPLVGKMKILK